ncbi:hypothetical protein T02_8872 [Trichinella nativa]|uniref:Uncharacterized protein n=1 Tax=Trichinella nativa TaxID=6335 RepID=A0A0V1LKR0_9BILA|nr:hypothetical protein T02_8872 [Trichinella nativa]
MCGYLIELSLIAQGETSLQMLGKQIDSQLMSNYWAHTWYLFKFLEQAILCHLKVTHKLKSKQMEIALKFAFKLDNAHV